MSKAPNLNTSLPIRVIAERRGNHTHYKIEGTNIDLVTAPPTLTVFDQSLPCDLENRIALGERGCCVGCGEIEIHEPSFDGGPCTVRIGPVWWVEITMDAVQADKLAHLLASHASSSRTR